MAEKTTCPVSRKEFAEGAKPLVVTINGQNFGAMPRAGEEGKSAGYYINGKITITVNGKPVVCQIGLNVSAVGSKDLPVELERPAISPEVAKIMAESKARAKEQELAGASA